MSDLTLDELLLQNPNAPTNDYFALEFARRLYPPAADRPTTPQTFDFAEGRTNYEAADEEGVDWCGEATRGLLDAVMASSLLSASAREQIAAMQTDAEPTLERNKVIGHFHFYWTQASSNAQDNTTEANIDATGAVLNDCWNRYVVDFRQPKAALVDGVRRINVRVYYDAGLHGSTSSRTNAIFLNSATVVNDSCRRQTVSAHELFHRVEYSYGYVTGTAGQRWWVEALGSWSQEYYAPAIDDYISRVNTGLNTPGTGLLSRSYDACHYWKYLGEQVSRRSSAVVSEEQAIRETLDTYSTNGLNMQAASGNETSTRISRSFDLFFQDWSKANVLKDLTSPSPVYDYNEDETVTTVCGRTYGPYRHIAPDTDQVISANSTNWASGTLTVDNYASRYHNFRIGSSVTEFELRFDGNVGGGFGVFSLHLVLIKDNYWRVIYNSPSTTDKVRHVSFATGTYDRCLLVVDGLRTGGTYSVGLNACITGTWTDGYGFVWTLTQAGDDIAGTVRTRSCGTYTVTGTLSGNAVTLRAVGNCCDFTYTGNVVECSSASGNWTNDCGGSGTWAMTKTDGADVDAAFLEELEVADDPTTAQA